MYTYLNTYLYIFMYICRNANPSFVLMDIQNTLESIDDIPDNTEKISDINKTNYMSVNV